MSIESLQRAGGWLAQSGIQEESGGVSRYYRAAEDRYLPVSTEITGYAVSAFCWLYRRLDDISYLKAAEKSARFLTQRAFHRELETFPFECLPGSPAYFFDCGIIARGLLALWRLNGDAELLEVTEKTGRSMARDFLTETAIHPVVSMPDRKSLPYECRWSREPGCYQLKSALAWKNLALATGREEFTAYWKTALGQALAANALFLPGESDEARVMDRLHAYGYFLEALLAEPEDPACRLALSHGIRRAAAYLREISPKTSRSDVLAQLLRVRLFAHHLGIVALDTAASGEEAEALHAFQRLSGEPRTHGAFFFGKDRSGWLPYANPVSTAFCLQAIDLYESHLGGEWAGDLDALI